MSCSSVYLFWGYWKKKKKIFNTIWKTLGKKSWCYLFYFDQSVGVYHAIFIRNGNILNERDIENMFFLNLWGIWKLTCGDHNNF